MVVTNARRSCVSSVAASERNCSRRCCNWRTFGKIQQKCVIKINGYLAHLSHSLTVASYIFDFKKKTNISSVQNHSAQSDAIIKRGVWHTLYWCTAPSEKSFSRKFTPHFVLVFVFFRHFESNSNRLRVIRYNKTSLFTSVMWISFCSVTDLT